MEERERRRRMNVLSALSLVGALAGGWYGRWAEGAGFAVSAISWGFAVVLVPLAVATAFVLARDRPSRAGLAAAGQAGMTLTFSVFAFALRTGPAEIARVPWQVLVVLAGDVVVTTAGLAIAAGGLAYALAGVGRQPVS